MFCPNFFTKFKKILKCVDAFLIKNVDTALLITGKIKDFLNSDIAVTIVSLTPTSADDILRARIVGALEKAMKTLGALSDGINEDEIVKFLQWLKSQTPGVQNTFLAKIGSLISQDLDGNRYREHLYDTFLQARYVEKKSDSVVVASL